MTSRRRSAVSSRPVLTVEPDLSPHARTVGLNRLCEAVVQYLEVYSAEPLVPSDSRDLVGEGDGDERRARLLDRVGYPGGAHEFFGEVVARRLGGWSRLHAARPLRLEVEAVVRRLPGLSPATGPAVPALRRRGVGVYAVVPLLPLVTITGLVG